MQQPRFDPHHFMIPQALQETVSTPALQKLKKELPGVLKRKFKDFWPNKSESLGILRIIVLHCIKNNFTFWGMFLKSEESVRDIENNVLLKRSNI